MLRRSLLNLVAAPACLSLSGCLAKKNEGQGVLLRVSSLPRTSMGPLYLAHEQGYFAEAGLDVSIRQLTYSTMAAPLLAGGELDASCLGLSPGLLNAAAKGSKVRIVACRGVFDPACGARGSLYGVRQVFPDGLQDLTLLKGKRVAIRKLLPAEDLLEGGAQIPKRGFSVPFKA